MIIGGMLVKNESNRWLKQVCEQMKNLCDVVIIVDDKSSDNTIEICKKYGFKINMSVESLWETNEVEQRKKLFDLCLSERKDIFDWILILDADEIIYDTKNLKKHMKILPLHINGFGFKLFDMWSSTHYRDDMFWQAHTKYWPMAVRIFDTENLQWNNSRLHCGRFPITNLYLHQSLYKIKHMGWSTENDRIKKYKRYMKIDGCGKYGWLEQYKSILDKNPRLVKFSNKIII